MPHLSQVARAAAQLVAASTNPTVDTVRAALGNTGSKGTTAPMLKQWKAQYQGETAAAGTGLLADLLEAVKGAYQRLEAGAQAQVEQLRDVHDKAATRVCSSWRPNAPPAASCAPSGMCSAPRWPR